MPVAGGRSAGPTPVHGVLFLYVCVFCTMDTGSVVLSGGPFTCPQALPCRSPHSPTCPTAHLSQTCHLRCQLLIHLPPEARAMAGPDLAQPLPCFSPSFSLRLQNPPFSLASPIHMGFPGAWDSAPFHLRNCSHPHPPAPPHPWKGCGSKGQQTSAAQPPWALFPSGW